MHDEETQKLQIITTITVI